jgi:hypothetical protein
MSEFTAQVLLEKLTMAGVRTEFVTKAMDEALGEANACDIRGVIEGMMLVDEEFTVVHHHLNEVERRQQADVSAARAIAFRLQQKAVDDVVAALIAKQCRCG